MGNGLDWIGGWGAYLKRMLWIDIPFVKAEGGKIGKDNGPEMGIPDTFTCCLPMSENDQLLIMYEYILLQNVRNSKSMR